MKELEVAEVMMFRKEAVASEYQDTTNTARITKR